jgi:hypothetical protein
MVFEAPWLSRLAVGGLYRFSLGLSDRDRPHQLVLAWQPARSGWEQEDQGEVDGQRVLLDGVESVKISYFGAVEADSEPIWLPDWPENAPTPTLISIDLRFTDHVRQWPPFVVRPAG